MWFPMFLAQVPDPAPETNIPGVGGKLSQLLAWTKGGALIAFTMILIAGLVVWAGGQSGGGMFSGHEGAGKRMVGVGALGVILLGAVVPFVNGAF